MKFIPDDLLLYAVTDRTWLKGKTLAETVEAALQGGVTLIQLREKELDDEGYLAEALEIKAICDRYEVPLIINDNVDIALASGADGVHLGQKDGDVAKARERLGKNKIIGVSARTLEQALKAQAIVDEEVTTFMRWRESLALQPTIVDLLGQGENIARRELRRSIRQMGADPDPQIVAIMERLAQSLAHKIYHEPINYLKRRAQEEGVAQNLIHTTRRIFNLDGEEIPRDAHLNRKNK